VFVAGWSSSTHYVLAVAVPGLGLLMLVVIIIIAVVVCRKRWLRSDRPMQPSEQCNTLLALGISVRDG